MFDLHEGILQEFAERAWTEDMYSVYKEREGMSFFKPKVRIPREKCEVCGLTYQQRAHYKSAPCAGCK